MKMKIYAIEINALLFNNANAAKIVHVICGIKKREWPL